MRNRRRKVSSLKWWPTHFCDIAYTIDGKNQTKRSRSRSLSVNGPLEVRAMLLIELHSSSFYRNRCVKSHLHQAKAKVKTKIFFGV